MNIAHCAIKDEIKCKTVVTMTEEQSTFLYLNFGLKVTVKTIVPTV